MSEYLNGLIENLELTEAQKPKPKNPNDVLD